jgi:hypothetical protein
MQVKIWGIRILSVHLNGQSDYQMYFPGLVEEPCLGISLQLLLHVSSTPSRVKRGSGLGHIHESRSEDNYQDEPRTMDRYNHLQTIE